jgi:hypothetical protein
MLDFRLKMMNDSLINMEYIRINGQELSSSSQGKHKIRFKRDSNNLDKNRSVLITFIVSRSRDHVLKMDAEPRNLSHRLASKESMNILHLISQQLLKHKLG